ncbi:hypothetical protein CRUP_013333 [Coryphaenoides rupestris]|nr:hypothetical protein CRUP_013333 [Coryphaenoides rupestris]
MGKIQGCLKCLFIFFNVVFAIVGVLLVIAAVKLIAFSKEFSAAGAPSLGWFWVFSIGMLLVSCLGVVAACTERLLLLKVFAGLMAVGVIVMMIFGIIIAVYRNKIKGVFEGNSDFRKELLKEDTFKAVMDGFQQAFMCCGIVRAEDWGDTIPDSCTCSRSIYISCAARPQSCGKILFGYADLVFKIAMGFFFGFAVTALLSLLVTLLMIRQVKNHDGGGGQSMAMKGY